MHAHAHAHPHAHVHMHTAPDDPPPSGSYIPQSLTASMPSLASAGAGRRRRFITLRTAAPQAPDHQQQTTRTPRAPHTRPSLSNLFESI
eukprot:10956500-Alexandrium_andersonii.AAC.1